MPLGARRSNSSDEDPLFRRLLLLYEWMQPSIEWRMRQRAQSATNSFRNDWHKLLPTEREDVVDLLVSRYCLLQADPKHIESWDMLGYQFLCRKVKKADASIKGADAHNEVNVLRGFAVQIERACPSPEVEAWKRRFFGDEGVTATKLLRIPLDAWIVLRKELEQTLELSSHLTYLKEVRSVLLSSREAESFARLSAHKQVSAIKLAREHLFSACETRKATARYLPLRSIVKELCAATMHDHLPGQPAPASSHGDAALHGTPGPARPPITWLAPDTLDRPPQDMHSLHSLAPPHRASARHDGDGTAAETGDPFVPMRRSHRQ